MAKAKKAGSAPAAKGTGIKKAIPAKKPLG
jgi:hypothetical protein